LWAHFTTNLLYCSLYTTPYPCKIKDYQ